MVILIQDRVYGLALRMLYHPADAEDAAQEILIKVITHLDGFRGESSFGTWVYRIAANHLLSTRRSRGERAEVTLEEVEGVLDRAEAAGWKDSSSRAQQELLANETRLTCMQGLLLNLDRDHRIALILGVVFQLSSEQGAYILEITPEAFRKRLSRARARLRRFMSKNCCLLNQGNRCRCERMVEYDIKAGWINPRRLLFATHSRRGPDPNILSSLNELDELGRISALFQSYPSMAAPEHFLEDIKKLIDSDRFRVFKPS